MISVIEPTFNARLVAAVRQPTLLGTRLLPARLAAVPLAAVAGTTDV